MDPPVSRRLWLLALKLGGLLSACGGPLVLYDQLRPATGPSTAFALTFAPTALLLVGAFSLRDDDADQLGRIAIFAGTFGAVVLAAMDVYGVWVLATGRQRADGGLIQLGIAVGAVTVALYLQSAWAWARRSRR